MAAPINTNRYRLILLLYLVFICLSLLSVPASLLESNLYVIRTLSYQEQIIQKQLSRSDQLVNDVDSLTLTKQPSIKVFIGLQQEIRRSFLFLDSIENALLDTLRSQGTSVEREYAKRRKLNSFLLKTHWHLRSKRISSLWLVEFRSMIQLLDQSLVAGYPQLRGSPPKTEKKSGGLIFSFLINLPQFLTCSLNESNFCFCNTNPITGIRSIVWSLKLCWLIKIG